MFIRGEARLVLSDTTVTELSRAPSRVRELPDLVPPEHVEKIGPQSKARPLAALYIQERIMRPSMYIDALHIATATVVGGRSAATTPSTRGSGIQLSTFASHARCSLMEAEEPPIKAVEMMRQIRDKLNAEMEGKSLEEIQRIIHERAIKSEIWQRLEERSKATSSR